MRPDYFQKSIYKKLSGDEDGWYQIADLDERMHPSDDFYAQLYVKFLHGRALSGVVAFRGTLPLDWDNDVVNYHTWASDVIGFGKHDQLPKYYSTAEFFYHDALRYMCDELDCFRLSVTGHSLGGAIAQLFPALSEMPSTAITFNSPGIGHIPGVSSAHSVMVHGINSTYGFLNKIGKPFGKVNYVNVPEEEARAKQVFDDIAKEKSLSREIEAAKTPEERLKLLYYLSLEDYYDSLCDEADFALSAGAQHSINNLLKTLHEKRHSHIAGKMYL